MEHLNVPRGTLYDKLAFAVSSLMQTKRFPLWALGVNFFPICTNRSMVRAATVLMLGRDTKSSVEMEQVKDALTKLRKHPHIKWLLRTGYRINPAERPIYRPGILWQSVEEKAIWMETGGEAARRLKIAQKTMRQKQRLGLIGGWLQYK